MESFNRKVGVGGRIHLPVTLLKKLELGKGDDVSVTFEEGVIKIKTLRQKIAEIHTLVKQYDTGTGSVVDTLIAERREEARKEAEALGEIQ